MHLRLLYLHLHLHLHLYMRVRMHLRLCVRLRLLVRLRLRLLVRLRLLMHMRPRLAGPGGRAQCMPLPRLRLAWPGRAGLGRPAAHCALPGLAGLRPADANDVPMSRRPVPCRAGPPRPAQP
jgi:hypothetical protein